MAKTVCAIIEFEAADAAKFAVQTLRFRTKELGFRLALLETGVNTENFFLHYKTPKNSVCSKAEQPHYISKVFITVITVIKTLLI